jgi:mannose/fructose/N-acetylgalactosamine-specific phosphotransferase system component IIC
MIELLPLTLLGAMLGLDVVSFPQAMISRPIVSATLAGAWVGAPGRGLVAGAVLELFALETLPFGASRYPEWGSAGVVGGAVFALRPEGTTGALAVAVFASLLTAMVSGWSMIQHRRGIGRWAAGMRDALASGQKGAVTTLQLRGMTADLLRGGLVTFAALGVFVPLSQAVLASWTLAPAPSRAVVVALAGATALGAVWKNVHSTKHAPLYLLGGFAAGLLLLGVA